RRKRTRIIHTGSRSRRTSFLAWRMRYRQNRSRGRWRTSPSGRRRTGHLPSRATSTRSAKRTSSCCEPQSRLQRQWERELPGDNGFGADAEATTVASYRVHLCFGPNCSERGSRALMSVLERAIAEAGLADAIEVLATTCRNRCEDGPSLNVYPGPVF